MTLTGGNYGGYTIEGEDAVLYEDSVVVDTQTVVLDATNLIIEGWVYNEEGIFIGV